MAKLVAVSILGLASSLVKACADGKVTDNAGCKGVEDGVGTGTGLINNAGCKGVDDGVGTGTGLIIELRIGRLTESGVNFAILTFEFSLSLEVLGRVLLTARRSKVASGLATFFVTLSGELKAASVRGLVSFLLKIESVLVVGPEGDALGRLAGLQLDFVEG